MMDNPTHMMKNVHLDGDAFLIEGNHVGVVLLHGFTATTAEVRLLADYLRGFGYTLSAPLLPGHGTQPEELNKTSWIDWYEAAERAYLELRGKCTKVFVCGESMGALLALLVASRYAQVDGIIAVAPALKIRGIELSRVMQYFVKFRAKNQAEDNLPWKGYMVYSMRGLAQLAKLQNIVQKELDNITQPLLVFMGGKDASIHPESGKIIINTVKSSEKELIYMPYSPHVMLLAKDKEAIFQKIYEFIEAHC
jgi:carboxylesterase